MTRERGELTPYFHHDFAWHEYKVKTSNRFNAPPWLVDLEHWFRLLSMDFSSSDLQWT